MTIANNNDSYIQLDYFKELAEKAYQEDESFDAFVERMAMKYFPGFSKEWMQKYAFSIRFYGICVEACQNCTGDCPHNGHQYHLRIKKGSSCPVPWASAAICVKYKRKPPVKDNCFEDVEIPEVVDPNPDMQESFEAYNPFSVVKPKKVSKAKYEEPSLL